MTGDERRHGTGDGERPTRRRSVLRAGTALLASSIAGCATVSSHGHGPDRRDAPVDTGPNATTRNASNASSASETSNASNTSNASKPPDQTFPFTEPKAFFGFENENYENQFTKVDQWNSENRRIVPRSVDDGTALAVTMRRGAHWGTILRYQFKKAGYAEPEELYARFYLRFPRDFEAIRGGGKLPGFSGQYNGLAFGGHPTDGTDGWSARGGFEPAYRGARPDEVPLTLYYYVYHADMNGQFGDRFYWDERIDRGRWYRIDQYVRMNTPGKRNAILRAWIDGDLVCDVTTLRFRDVGYGNIKVKSYLLTAYYGGFWTSPSDNTVFFDDLTLSWPDGGSATGGNGSTNGTRQ